MGLDTFATTRRGDGKWEPAPDEPFEGLRLCGGMYSGGSDSSSIRGKVYAELFEEATGESLYQHRIEPARVAEIARRVRATVDEAKREGTLEIDPEEAEDLARWFEVCAERGYAVEGWW
jgi:hypothetical protein